MKYLDEPRIQTLKQWIILFHRKWNVEFYVTGCAMVESMRAIYVWYMVLPTDCQMNVLKDDVLLYNDLDSQKLLFVMRVVAPVWRTIVLVIKVKTNIEYSPYPAREQDHTMYNVYHTAGYWFRTLFDSQGV